MGRIALVLLVAGALAGWSSPTEIASDPGTPQRLTWGPGDAPELAFELAGESQRVARLMPGAAKASSLRTGRAPTLQGLDRSVPIQDASPTWWSEFELAVVRDEDGSSRVAMDDGVVRALDGEYGAAREVVRWGSFLVVRSEDSGGTDLHLIDPRRPEAGRRLTETRSVVERSLAPRQGGLMFIEVDGETTSLCTLTMTDRQPCTSYPQLELLALAEEDIAGGTIAFARRRLPDQGPQAVLVQLTAAGKWTLLAEDVWLPEGYTPRPAVDAAAGVVRYVVDGEGRPIAEIAVATKTRTVLSLGTRNHREIATRRAGPGALAAVVADGQGGPRVFVYKP